MRLNFWSVKPLPKIIPEELQAEIGRVRLAQDQPTAVRLAYKILTRKYRGVRVMTYLRLLDLFRDDITALWAKDGFLHCTNLNYLLAVLLVKSGQFQVDDLRFRWTHVYFLAPHQYVEVRLADGTRINVDCWSAVYGVPFGQYAHGLTAGRVRA